MQFPVLQPSFVFVKMKLQAYADFLQGLSLEQGYKVSFKARQSLSTGQLFWPSAAVGEKTLNYADSISLRVFPRVLHLLYLPQLRRLLEFLHKKSTSALPSLLHLLLLYT